MSDVNKSNARYRHFATVVYLDSADPDWLSIIESQFTPCFVSPYHDHDLNSDGTKKKPHHHVLFTYDGKKSVDQVRDIFARFGGVGCEVVGSFRGYARYLCHLDNPDKAQYKIEDVRAFAGADYLDAIGLPSDRYKCIIEMEDFVERYDVMSFHLLARYASAHRSDWHKILVESASVYMREYLKSRKWSKDMGYLHIVDKANGDIII